MCYMYSLDEQNLAALVRDLELNTKGWDSFEGYLFDDLCRPMISHELAVGLRFPTFPSPSFVLYF